MIRVQGLKKRFDGRTILDGVAVDLAEGKVTSLLGPSGSGKSTLLRCVNGLETFEAGSVTVGEHVYRGGKGKDDARALAGIRLSCGMVFQQFHLFPQMTALANVMLAPMQVKKIGREEAEKRALELIERVGLSHRKDAYPRELSGGEQQRVALARALAMEPKALLLDEPTSALDPERKGEVIEVLAELARAGTTMILVTHEMSFARKVSDRVIVLHSGSIVEDGDPEAVLEGATDARARAFLGRLSL
jgi:polar amino acid transport system ATP-binding protein